VLPQYGVRSFFPDWRIAAYAQIPAYLYRIEKLRSARFAQAEALCLLTKFHDIDSNPRVEISVAIGWN